MSQWTHITGTIRVDFISLIKEKEFPVDLLFDVLGTPCGYETYQNYKPGKAELPLGSEGSLQWRFVKTQESEGSAAYGVIYMWGDLRDYDNVSKINEWFSQCIRELNSQENGGPILIRNAVLHIDVEFKQDVVLLLQNGEVHTFTYEFDKRF